MAAGLDDCLDFIEAFRFKRHELEYLDETSGLGDQTLNALRALPFGPRPPLVGQGSSCDSRIDIAHPGPSSELSHGTVL